jgi:peptide chain release factor subunit 3
LVFGLHDGRQSRREAKGFKAASVTFNFVQGITVEVGRAHFATANKRFTILDAPGHKNYVPNMITGVAQADVGVLVISARKGEFEAGFDRSGQTREHALLAKTLGVKKLVIVINKMDEPTVEWSKERYDNIQSKLGAYLKSVSFSVPIQIYERIAISCT